MKLKEFKADLKPEISRHQFRSHKDIINKLLVGNVISRMKNRGYEFEDFRQYTSGDDSQRIDWRASLKSNQLLIRQTAEEKSVNVLFLVDVSDTMLFSSGDKLKCEYAAEIVSALAFLIQKEGNSIGLCLFSDSIVKSMKPKIGQRQYFTMIKELTRHTNYGGGCSLKNAIKSSLAIMKTPALLMIVSDFINLGEEWGKYLKIASLEYNVMGLCIRDRLDRHLPEDIGYFVLEDPSSERKILVDTKEAHRKYNLGVLEDENYIDKTFKQSESSCLILQTDEEYSKPLIKFLKMRSRIKK